MSMYRQVAKDYIADRELSESRFSNMVADGKIEVFKEDGITFVRFDDEKEEIKAIERSSDPTAAILLLLISAFVNIILNVEHMAYLYIGFALLLATEWGIKNPSKYMQQKIKTCT